ncbi:hypothetical protein [Psychrobacillus sp. MER TA 171]|uniref:hypothetical protein n=1 Tax=Psychrobacillus sp. MER TA 171 TaxID=2939577 RepID=UPI00203FED2D|nr:hypothetical protein [Psychrobacillus sp. MER TA 171]MCM3359379.1 hypothetical protein [Psychrobacillus sp. MER TA 171]
MLKPMKMVAIGFYVLAFLLYLLSFLWGFSIGLYVLLPTIFVLLIGIAVNLGLYKKQKYYVVPLITSIVICGITYPLWHFLVLNVDDAFIFFPFIFFV